MRAMAIAGWLLLAACDLLRWPPEEEVAPPSHENVALVVERDSEFQSAQTGEKLARPIVVILSSQSGPIAGAEIHWTAVGGGAPSEAMSRTDEQGRAAVDWTLGPDLLQAMRATAPKFGLTVSAYAGHGSEELKVTFCRPTDPYGLRECVPLPGRYADDIVVRPKILNAVRPLTSMRFLLGPTEVVATPPTATSTTNTSIPIADVPWGIAMLAMTVRDEAGATADMAVEVIIDRPPVIEVLSPEFGSVQRRSFSVHARCIDDDPAGCTEIQLQQPAGTVVASSAIEIFIPNMTAPADGPFELTFEAFDSQGRNARANTAFQVESSAAIEIERTFEGQIADIRGDDVLIVIGDRLIVKSRSTSAELGAAVASSPIQAARLSAGGVYFTTRGVPGSVATPFYKWTPGESAPQQIFADIDEFAVDAAGAYLAVVERIYTPEGPDYRLVRIDCASGATVEVMPERPIHPSVADNGAIASGIRSCPPSAPCGYDVWWFNADALAAVATGSTVSTAPKTDGVDVLFRYSTSTAQQRPEDLVLYLDGQLTTILGNSTSLGRHFLAGGFVAFSDGEQIWRYINGASERVTNAYLTSIPHALSPEGTVFFERGTSLLALPVAGTERAISSASLMRRGVFAFREGATWILHGPTLLRLNP